MKMKCRLVISISIGLDDLPIGDLRILDEYVYIRAAFTLCSADYPFDRKPMVGFMRCRNNRRETTHYGNGEKPLPPSRLTLCDLSAPHVIWTDDSFSPPSA